MHKLKRAAFPALVFGALIALLGVLTFTGSAQALTVPEVCPTASAQLDAQGHCCVQPKPCPSASASPSVSPSASVSPSKPPVSPPASPSVSPSASASPSTSAAPSTTSSASTPAVGLPSSGQGGSADTLPVTGTAVWLIAVGGLALVVLGAGAIAVSRRRQRFDAV